MFKKAFAVAGLVLASASPLAQALTMNDCAQLVRNSNEYYSCVDQVYAEQNAQQSSGSLHSNGWVDNSISCSELVRWPELFWECQAENSP